MNNTARVLVVFLVVIGVWIAAQNVNRTTSSPVPACDYTVPGGG